MYIHIVLPHQKIKSTNYKYSDESDNDWNVHYFTVTELTTDPVATVPPDPGVRETTPALVTEPASDPAVPVA